MRSFSENVYFQVRIAYETGEMVFDDLIAVCAEEATNEREVVEYVAARVNNVAMMLGGTRIQIVCKQATLAEAVVEEILNVYPQVTSVLYGFYCAPVTIESSPGFARPVARFSFPQLRKLKRFAQIDQPVCTVGVNIGQTAIKLALMQDAEVLQHTKIAIPTWVDKSRIGFDDLYRRTIALISNSLQKHGLVGKAQAIGICVGGMVRWGRVTIKSGVALDMSPDDFEAYCDLAGKIEQRFGITALMAQDMVCSGYALSSLHGVSDALVVGIGTGTGGVYVDRIGDIPDVVNALGRTVIAISESAKARPDGKARGVVAQYLSLKGLEWLCESQGLDASNEEQLARLYDQGDPRAIEVIGSFADYLVNTVCAVADCREFGNIVLTGGVVNGRLGDILIEVVKQRWVQPGPFVNLPISLSFDPLFDSCIGAALMAADRYYLSFGQNNADMQRAE